MLVRNRVNNSIYIRVCDWSLKLHFPASHFSKKEKEKKLERKMGNKAMTEQESKINTMRYNFFKVDCRFR